MLLLLLLLTSVALGNPTCHWVCDDPVCEAVCTPICQPTVCNYICPGSPSAFCYQPACWTSCAGAIFNATECPACETQCGELQCIPSTATCQIQCQPPECSWSCVKPLNCPQPTCQLQCENYACQPPVPSSAAKMEALLVMLGMLLFL